MSTATRFSVRFLGCKVSQADAALIRDALRDAGHVETAPEAAEVVAITTKTNRSLMPCALAFSSGR